MGHLLESYLREQNSALDKEARRQTLIHVVIVIGRFYLSRIIINKKSF